MIRQASPSNRRDRAQIFVGLGADVGATLVKLAIQREDGRSELRFASTRAIERVAREVESIGAERVGLTGGGAAALARHLNSDTARVREFDAWAAGSRAMLQEAGIDAGERYLLVSLGTGTSAMLVDGPEVTRVGGTALGGGTLLGLGAALTGESEFEVIVALASQGDRRRVDLLVSEIYPEDELPLRGDLNAASFAKLARERNSDPRDLAHGVVGLVGENVGLICGALAAAAGTPWIVYGGTSLRNNDRLADILRVMGAVRGQQVAILPEGEFTGAVGALLAATQTPWVSG